MSQTELKVKDCFFELMPYKNKEDRSARRRWRYLNEPGYKERLNEDTRKRWKALPPEIRHARSRKNYRKIKQQIFDKFGNHCANQNCRWINDDGSIGCTDKRCLQIDHVLGGGNKELQTPNGLGRLVTVKYLKKVLADTQGMYQLLCSNCNWIKRVVNGEVRKYAK